MVRSTIKNFFFFFYMWLIFIYFFEKNYMIFIHSITVNIALFIIIFHMRNLKKQVWLGACDIDVGRCSMQAHGSRLSVRTNWWATYVTIINPRVHWLLWIQILPKWLDPSPFLEDYCNKLEMVFFFNSIFLFFSSQ